jgi:hypothetical protein
LTFVHLLLSLCALCLIGVLVFGWWYPSPYSRVAGAVSLFAMLAGVDAVLGPALTATIASAGKRSNELRRDIGVIVVVQLVALAYGVFTLAAARPVYLVFEVDRMRLVSAADIEPALLAQASEGFRSLSWSGPRLIAAVKPTDPDEQIQSLQLALGGYDLAMVPKNWKAFDEVRASAWQAAHPIDYLLARHPEQAQNLSRLARATGLSMQSFRFLPLQSRHSSDWTAILAPPDARLVGLLPVDGFFQ